MVNPAASAIATATECDGVGKRKSWLVVSGTKRPASEAIRTLRMTTQEIALALSAASFGLIWGFSAVTRCAPIFRDGGGVAIEGERVRTIASHGKNWRSTSVTAHFHRVPSQLGQHRAVLDCEVDHGCGHAVAPAAVETQQTGRQPQMFCSSTDRRRFRAPGVVVLAAS